VYVVAEVDLTAAPADAVVTVTGTPVKIEPLTSLIVSVQRDAAPPVAPALLQASN
jgi:hypothetical protein